MVISVKISVEITVTVETAVDTVKISQEIALDKELRPCSSYVLS